MAINKMMYHILLHLYFKNYTKDGPIDSKDRSEIVKFERFSKSDIKTIVKELSEIELTDCAIKYIYSNLNRFRQIVKVINKASQPDHIFLIYSSPTLFSFMSFRKPA